MNFPAELKYTKDHEWIKLLDGGEALVGISEVHTELEDEPQMLNEDPYGAWIARIRDVSACGELMSAEEYEAFVQK